MSTEILETPSVTVADHNPETASNSLGALLEYAHERFGVSNLSEITFSHGVNSEEELHLALANPDLMALECDVDFFDDKVMVYHLGQEEDPMDLTTLLESIKQSDKILKLDFKTRSSILPGLTQLAKSGLAQPVILNADIVDGHTIDFGPIEWGARIVPEDFISACKTHYPEGILSLSWSLITWEKKPLSAKNVDEMVAAVGDMENVIFPIRADIAEASWSELQRLLSAAPGRTAAIWNNPVMPLTKNFIEWARNTAGKNVIYALVDCNDNPVKLSEGLDNESPELRRRRLGFNAAKLAVDRALKFAYASMTYYST